MQIRNNIKFFLVFVLFLFSEGNSQSATTIEKEIRSIMNEQVLQWNNGNIEGFMQGYAAVDSLRFASGGSVTYGWHEMLSRYKKHYPNKDSMGTLLFSQISITVISNNAALVFGKWELQRANDHPQGLFTLLFRKLNNTWRIVHDHTSSAK